MPSDLIRGWMPVRVKKTRQKRIFHPFSILNSICSLASWSEVGFMSSVNFSQAVLRQLG